VSEKFELKKKLIHERFSVEEGPVTVSGSFTAGEVNVEAEADPDKLSAEAHAEATTVHVEAEAQTETPVGNHDAHAEASGPSAYGGANVSPEGFGLGAGASVGEVEAGVGADIGGSKYEAEAGLGLDAEFKFEVSPENVEVELGPFSVTAPSPKIFVDIAGELVDGEEPDDHAVTTDDLGGPSAKPKPGSQKIDY
jgi:hypothetical protein